MAKFDKIAVMQKIGEAPMVPVFYNKDLEICKKVVKACYEGGVRAFEFTNRGDFAHEVFGELVKWADKECPELAIGVGSVVDAPTASLYIQLGANFVVGPNMVKGLKAPMPWSKIMVTGGVSPDEENLTKWFKAGVYCVGMGSKLFPSDKVKAGDWQYVTDKCKEAFGYIAKARA